MFKHLTVILAFLMTLSSPVAAQDFQKGYDAYQAGDYSTALQKWKPLADQGHAWSQYSLGLMYDTGKGVLQDYAEAARLYRLAAEQGNVYAQSSLGAMHYNGIGVLQDFAEAMKWYRLAADQGYAAAQTNLGTMYMYGRGVLEDGVTAHMWYNIGAANGSQLGGENRDNIAAYMTSSEISKAQEMARECISSNYKNCGSRNSSPLIADEMDVIADEMDLMANEMDGLIADVGTCWTVGSLSEEARNIAVTVRFELTEEARVDPNSVELIDATAGSEAAIRQVFESARRAILLCGSRGFDLPMEKYDQWRIVEMVFNPAQMRLR